MIDIPIGLPESIEESIHRPDVELRQLLKGKASSVFPVPCRQAVFELDKLKAKEINIKELGKSISEQTFGICRCIREVDIFLQNNPEWKNRLMESHPEYCFSILNNNNPIIEKKTKEDGQKIRIQVLKKYYNNIEITLEKIPKGIKLDDALDSFSLAIMAKLIDEYGIITVPTMPCYDKKGLKMQIVVSKFEYN